MRYCKVCGDEIPAGRLKILPNTDTCVNHANPDIPVGMMIFDHKTAPTMIIVTKEQAQAMNRADRRGFKNKGNKIWEDK